MTARCYSLFIDETGDTDAPGKSAVVGLLVDRAVGAEEQKALRKELENLCKGLTWAIHAAALNTPGVFLRDWKKREGHSVVVKELEPEARALAEAGLQPRQLEDWSLPGPPDASVRAREAAAKLANVTRNGRARIGEFLCGLRKRLGARVTLVATVCGEARELEPIAGLTADGYVRALRRTCQTAAELAAEPNNAVNIDIHVLGRGIRRADRPRAHHEALSPTYALRIAEDGVRRAKVPNVSVSGRPHVYPWNPQTSAMLVLADHAANRFGQALAASRADEPDAFRRRVVEIVGLDARLAADEVRRDGLAHLYGGGPDAPLWARRLPPGRER